MNIRKNAKGSGWNERELGALWVKTKFGGDQKFLTGHIKIPVGHPADIPLKIVLFPNQDFKGGENRPHYRIYKHLDKEGKVEAPRKAPKQEVEDVQWTSETSEGDGSLDDPSIWAE
ncbi:MAG: hypothetical protein VW270_14005 [Candidatus Poseidoniales archaeon]